MYYIHIFVCPSQIIPRNTQGLLRNPPIMRGVSYVNPVYVHVTTPLGRDFFFECKNTIKLYKYASHIEGR